MKKEAKEFSPGIPIKDRKLKVPKVNKSQKWDMAIQRHSTKRAPEHYDLRLIKPGTNVAHSWAVRNLPRNPGDKTLAVLQPTHTAAYATWEGEIESGYGAGKVTLFQHDKIEVTKSDDRHITFNVYKSNGQTERYALIHTGGDNWLFYNYTPTRKSRPEIPASKKSYKSIDISKLDLTDGDKVISPKIDGAANVFVLRKNKPVEVYSYRPSKKETELIDHTYRLPTYRKIVPDEYGTRPTVLMGEVFARDRSGKVLPSTETASRLLSNVWRSRELQKKAPLDNIIYDVLQYKGKDVSSEPYEEKLKLISKITKDIPELKAVPIYRTAEEKRRLIESIERGRNPLTREGVILLDLKSSDPQKAKFREDHDVYIRDIFPGEGKYRGKAAGGFTYSYIPGGKIIGRVGGGFSDELRKQMWKDPEKFRGSLARVYAQGKYPSGKLRVPQFKDMREAEKFAKLAASKKDPFLKILEPAIYALHKSKTTPDANMIVHRAKTKLNRKKPLSIAGYRSAINRLTGSFMRNTERIIRRDYRN